MLTAGTEGGRTLALAPGIPVMIKLRTYLGPGRIGRQVHYGTVVTGKVSEWGRMGLVVLVRWDDGRERYASVADLRLTV